MRVAIVGLQSGAAGVVGQAPIVSGFAVAGVGLTGGGTGDLLIETGGQLSSAGANAVVGDATGGAGAVTITGPDASWRMTSNLVVGATEAGSFTCISGWRMRSMRRWASPTTSADG